jgi:tRNA (cmo5U34)-methyltransferase
MRATVADLVARFAQPYTYVVDLGCSRGETIATVRDKVSTQLAYAGIEVSPPMIAAARERFSKPANLGDVTIFEHDLRNGLPLLPQVWGTQRVSVVLAVLTLQFTPIEYRQRIVAAVRDRLAPGGAFIIVEKVLGASAKIDETLVAAYYDRKRAAGYSNDEIDRKRHSLEGVLVPVTARWNEELLHGAGFREVDCVWRALNFAGWLALA